MGRNKRRMNESSGEYLKKKKKKKTTTRESSSKQSTVGKCRQREGRGWKWDSRRKTGRQTERSHTSLSLSDGGREVSSSERQGIRKVVDKKTNRYCSVGPRQVYDREGAQGSGPTVDDRSAMITSAS